MKTPLLLLLRAYKLGVSPFLGQNCRFYPSCSDYAAQAVQVHGALRGSLLAARRLCKCHPWHPGGLDWVPGTEPADPAGPSGAASLNPAHCAPGAHPPSSPPQSRIMTARVHSTVADGCSHS